MKNVRLTILINKPIHEVFSFATNPENTPKWIESIVKEEASEWPATIGTTYKNQNTNGDWSEYSVTEYKETETFVLTKNDDNYHVRYNFIPVDENTTELEYFEWVTNGELEEPFTQEMLNTLKDVLET